MESVCQVPSVGGGECQVPSVGGGECQVPSVGVRGMPGAQRAGRRGS